MKGVKLKRDRKKVEMRNKGRKTDKKSEFLIAIQVDGYSKRI